MCLLFYIYVSNSSKDANDIGILSLYQVGSANLGVTKFQIFAFTGYKYMETDWAKYYDGSSTYTISSYSGTVASYVIAVTLSLVLPQYIASEVVVAVIAAGLGIAIGDSLQISTTITLLSDRYSHVFLSNDANAPMNYNTGSYVGYEYIIKDLNHPEYINNTYYDGYVLNDYYNREPDLYSTLFFNTYGVYGTPVFN